MASVLGRVGAILDGLSAESLGKSAGVLATTIQVMCGYLLCTLISVSPPRARLSQQGLQWYHGRV